MQKTEKWAEFPTDGRYEISSHGRVRNKVTMKVLKPSTGGYGYLLFPRYQGKKYTGMFIHQAVAKAFIGDRPNECFHVSHLDGNKLNNNVDNLVYETAKQNMERKKQHGTHNIGSKNSQSKLTEIQVIKMRELWDSKKASIKELCKMFDVAQMTVRRAVYRISWSET